MSSDAKNCLLVLTNMPDRDSAVALAQVLIDQRLAACVNVLDGCTSVYRWQGATQTDREFPVFIKTRVERFEALQEQILALHPYELPEVIALPIERGLEAYLAWVGAETDISR